MCVGGDGKNVEEKKNFVMGGKSSSLNISEDLRRRGKGGYSCSRKNSCSRGFSLEESTKHGGCAGERHEKSFVKLLLGYGLRGRYLKGRVS